MSVGRILTVGFGSFGGVNYLPTLGYSSAAFTPRISVTLTDANNDPIPNLTGLRAAWWDQPVLNNQVSPVKVWTAQTTDASGVLFTDEVVTGSALGNGGVGWLEVTDSDGTTSQSPVANVAAGPITVH